MTVRPRMIFDMEVYPNYTLLYFKHLATGALTYFESPLDATKLDAIREIVRSSTLVTFNGTGYDLPLLLYCLHGRTPEQVKAASDRIILQNLKPWNFEKEYKIKLNDPLIDHIDLMEVAPLTGSLKLYAGRLHSYSLQDLPYPPDKQVNEEMIREIRQYCANDLQSTEDLYKALKVQIELREEMSKMYGIDLRSKSDAQIAEAVIKTEIEKITKRKLEKPGDCGGVSFPYKIPGWMSFKTLDILDHIRKAVFVVGDKGSVLMPKELSDKKIEIGTGIYRMGIGGLHSSEACQVRKADANHVIMDFDVTSYYPAIVLNEGLYPAHIGPNFLQVYRSLVERRLAAKKAGQKTIAESLKICVNGTFGKLGSKWSVLYSPNLMIQVTVTGQLALLMLIESFWQIDGCEVISANTDGVTVRCTKAAQPAVLDAAETWELITNFSLERADYDALYSRDVNNYVAVKTNGEVKVKGVYGVGLPLQKNPVANICAKALIDHLTLDASIRGTIEECRDLRQFVCVRQVKGGATYLDQEIGRVVRWYYAKNSEASFHYKLNGYLVPKTIGAKPLVKISNYNALPNDLDYDWYVREATSMLHEVGGTPHDV